MTDTSTDTNAAAPRRGVFGMFVIAGVMIAVLIGLGLWQLERRTEKHALIAALTERLAAAPVPLPPAAEWKNLQPARDEFRRVTFTATFDAKPDAHVYSSGSALRTDLSGVGAFTFAPARLASGESVVVDLGFVPDGAQDRAALPALATPVTMTGYLRFPETAGMLTPHEEVAKRLWFVRDQRAMAAAYDWGAVAPFYVDLESPVPAAGVPKPGPLAVHLKDNHMQYAITWFGLAIMVFCAFGFWLAGERRARLQPH